MGVRGGGGRARTAALKENAVAGHHRVLLLPIHNKKILISRRVSEAAGSDGGVTARSGVLSQPSGGTHL